MLLKLAMKKSVYKSIIDRLFNLQFRGFYIVF